MNQQRNDNPAGLGVSADQAEALTERFFEQVSPRVGQGRAWTFHRFSSMCDDPKAEPVQAVLYPDDSKGFALYARQGNTLHPVNFDGARVVFRTFEHALNALADVAHLAPEIVVDISTWRRAVGPL